MFTVAVIGAGQLGSRYLQGLVSVEEELTVFAVDPNPKSRHTAQRRWEEGGGGSSPHKLRLCPSVSLIKDDIDIVIVSTPSVSRLDVVQSLREQRRGKSWILEKLLTNRIDELPRFREIFEGECSVWVNLPYRISAWHNEIRQEVFQSGPSKFVIRGEDYGLITNAVHYLDLVGWWMDTPIEQIEFEADTDGFFLSKRPGFVECHGSFQARYQDGSTVTMSCTKGPEEGKSAVGLIIEVGSSLGEWKMNEADGFANFEGGRTILGNMQLQSEMTAGLVSSIIRGRGCGLPRLAEVIPLHEKILAAVQLAWDQRPISDEKFVPIT